MVNVIVSGTIADATSGVNLNSAHFAVVDKYGSGQPSGNVTLAANGTYFFTIPLQASRLGTDQSGRTYTITVTAQDNAGNPSLATTTVIVPHDQGR
jgi:VCBS repeat-containing protein